MGVDSEFLHRCIRTLEFSHNELGKYGQDEVIYDAFCASCVKEFELTLELSGKLLRKCVGVFYANDRLADNLAFKNVFRTAAKHGLLGIDSVERWIHYRDCRNYSAQEYGENFADEILKLLPAFIDDVKILADIIDRVGNEG